MSKEILTSEIDVPVYRLGTPVTDWSHGIAIVERSPGRFAVRSGENQFIAGNEGSDSARTLAVKMGAIQRVPNPSDWDCCSAAA